MSESGMVATISRTELKLKIDRSDKFLLVETLSTAAYHHAHLPGAINLAPNQVKQLAPTLLPERQKLWCAAHVQRETPQKTPPVNWRRWAALTCEIMLKVNRIGLMQDCLWRAIMRIDYRGLHG